MRDRTGVSVTARIREIKQPRGGYLPPSEFAEKHLFDGQKLSNTENISPVIVGTVVDYLTRLMLGADKSEAFTISMQGAYIAARFGCTYAYREAERYLKQINGLDTRSIQAACKLVTFDEWKRNAGYVIRNGPSVTPLCDFATAENIRIMVGRSISFFQKYGPVTKWGPTFEGGYTETIATGDGDFLTEDTFWDFKVSKNPPTTKHTLQLLIYFLMGKHSVHPEFEPLTKIGIFNPRLNIVYTYDMKDFPPDLAEEIKSSIIGY
jgi:hypothetical protein